MAHRALRPSDARVHGWSLSEIPRGKHAQLYVVQDGVTIPISLYELTTYPDGGVRTSVSDLSRFFIALLNSGEYEGTSILDAKSVEEMGRNDVFPWFTLSGLFDSVYWNLTNYLQSASTAGATASP